METPTYDLVVEDGWEYAMETWRPGRRLFLGDGWTEMKKEVERRTTNCSRGGC
uniref:Uncharacterized protein n=1 Tax=Cucumis melo TaxID=3656 RepID=A0A9I9D6X8_CUCME